MCVLVADGTVNNANICLFAHMFISETTPQIHNYTLQCIFGILSSSRDAKFESDL